MMPVLFELLSPPGNFPRQIMAPVLSALNKIALAPFGEATTVDTGTSVVKGKTLYAFFRLYPKFVTEGIMRQMLTQKSDCVQRNTLHIHH